MYKFIIDTNSYSGNFEREMCAYMTGTYDEFTMVGAELADTFSNEDISKEISNNILFVQNKHFPEVLTPVLLEKTPNRVNIGKGRIVDENSIEAIKASKKYDAYESVAILFKENPEKFIKTLEQRAYSFANKYNLKIINFRLEKFDLYCY